jgi:hypothetical protein
MLTVPHVTNPWLPKPAGFSGDGSSETSNYDRELAAATAIFMAFLQVYD